MFISKKKFNQAIEEAKNEVYNSISREENRVEYERQQDKRIDAVIDRMDKVFSDIDRRLTELENKNKNREFFPISRY